MKSIDLLLISFYALGFSGIFFSLLLVSAVLASATRVRYQRGFGKFLAAGLVGPLLCAGAWRVRKTITAPYQTFEPRMTRFLMAPETPCEGSPRIAGRVLPVFKLSDEHEVFAFPQLPPWPFDYWYVWNNVDPVYFDLPASLRARYPEEVGTVVWIETRGVEMARYVGGSRIVQRKADVTLIDWRRQCRYSQQTLSGSAPAAPTVLKKTVHGSVERSGSDPRGPLLAWLLGLPKT